MSEQSAIEILQDLGLTEYQSRAYLAAVKLGRGRPADLAEESGVPQARIYDVIDDLQDADLIEVYDKPEGKEVTAPSPQSVLDQFRHRRIDELKENISEAITNLEPFYHRTEENPDAYVTMVGREESALRHIRRAIQQAEWWVTISIEGRIYSDLAEYIADAIDRGVTVRLLLSEKDPALEAFDCPDSLRVRYRQTADTFIAADREYGVFSSKHPARSGQPYIITQERNMVLLLQNYSEQIWSTSEIVRSADEVAGRYLDPWRVINDIKRILDPEAELYATVRGTDTETHRQGTWEGEIVDYVLSGPVEADYTIASPVEAELVLDTDRETLTVGGWKATIEDIAADGIEIIQL
ncbi:TrmB family transcriptional regulator [Halorhabdus amylolytica]|uniref:TrmB family transcriptional regulator n=1 Tax=Halorhabdus amylolytica TaxID=2559573 RepID=UPI0010AA45F8|nr:TrmB family transcriptional regulator [Halorhabdus amylolytica]